MTCQQRLHVLTVREDVGRCAHCNGEHHYTLYAVIDRIVYWFCTVRCCHKFRESYDDSR